MPYNLGLNSAQIEKKIQVKLNLVLLKYVLFK